MRSSPIYIPGESKFDPKFEYKPSGAIIVDGQEAAVTLQCAHCGRHWVPIRGSKRRRGFCMRCMKPTCGARNCLACLPYRERIEKRRWKTKKPATQVVAPVLSNASMPVMGMKSDLTSFPKK